MVDVRDVVKLRGRNLRPAIRPGGGGFYDRGVLLRGGVHGAVRVPHRQKEKAERLARHRLPAALQPGRKAVFVFCAVRCQAARQAERAGRGQMILHPEEVGLDVHILLPKGRVPPKMPHVQHPPAGGEQHIGLVGAGRQAVYLIPVFAKIVAARVGLVPAGPHQQAAGQQHHGLRHNAALRVFLRAGRGAPADAIQGAVQVGLALPPHPLAGHRGGLHVPGDEQQAAVLLLGHVILVRADAGQHIVGAGEAVAVLGGHEKGLNFV